MPDDSEDTARVLCTAGTWLKSRDPQGADRFYKALVRRCRKTTVGEQADKLRWFPAQSDDGEPPRLQTIEITAGLTNAITLVDGNPASALYPIPGRNYVIHDYEDVYVISRALARIGCALSVEDILSANPKFGRGPLPSGSAIAIPEMPGRP